MMSILVIPNRVWQETSILLALKNAGKLESWNAHNKSVVQVKKILDNAVTE